jgi:hypothetical protein
MFWTVLIIHYSMETLGITTLTHIAYSTEKKCSQAMKPMLKVVQRLLNRERIYDDLYRAYNIT